MEPITLRLSCQPAASQSGCCKPLQPMDAALLCWLALRGPTPRGQLAQTLWPAADDLAARGALRQRLYRLRQLLGVELVVGKQTLSLAAGVQHDLDGADGLLEGVEPGIAGAYADWLALERERRRGGLRQRRTAALDAAESAADYHAALRLALDWLDGEPEHEGAHTRVIRLHYLLGDRQQALAAYARCEQMLARTLAVAPNAATQALRRMLNAAAPLQAPVQAQGLPASLLRPPRLVGRDAEIAQAHAGWAAGKVVALVAEAGMGKSRLLQHLAPAAPCAAGETVVMVAARPGDASVPLSTLARLLRALPAAAQSLAPTTRRELARVLPEWGVVEVPPTAAAGARQMLQRAVQELLTAWPVPNLLVIDDLHFADGASLQLLQTLLDDAADPSTAAPHWALGYRPAEAGSPLHLLHDSLLDSARLQAVALSPLGESALAELVDALDLPGLDGRELAPLLWRRTGGNPMFVLETLKLGVTHAAQGLPALARPQSVTRLIGRRLQQLSPAALALARCAAVAGSDFDTRLAVHVLQTPAIALADAWAELEAAGVLRDQAFAHDLVYEATLASLPAPIARHLHGEVAAWLESHAAAAPATLARHWLAALQPARAAPHLQRAAQAAAQAYDVNESARLWGQLSELHATAGQADDAFEAAQAAVNALRSQTTGEAIEAAIRRLQLLALTTAQRAATAKQRAELCLAQGDLLAAASHTQQGLQLLGPDAPTGLRIALLNSHGVLMRRLGRLAEARSTLEEALTLARSVAQPAPSEAELPSVLNNLGLVLQEQDDHLWAAALMQEAAERQTDPTTRARVLNNLAISLEERGLVQLAHEQRLAAARAVAGSGGLAEAMLAISLGASARSLCRFREAMGHLERAGALGEGQQHHREEDLQRQFAALWMQLGRANLAREALEKALSMSLGAQDAALLGLVQARLALQLRQPKQALELLAPAKALLLQSGNLRALRRLWLVEAMALPPDQALALMERALADPGSAGNAGAALPLNVRASQAALALGRHAQALRMAERAADWLSAVHPLDMSPAEVWLTLGRAADAVQDRARARQAVGLGLAFVEQVAREHLDEVYREGWRARNPVNAELLELVARWRSD